MQHMYCSGLVRQDQRYWFAFHTLLKMQVLILDEISMISAEMFHQLEHYARIIRGVEKPFGGVQLILSGDYYQ